MFGQNAVWCKSAASWLDTNMAGRVRYDSSIALLHRTHASNFVKRTFITTIRPTHGHFVTARLQSSRLSSFSWPDLCEGSVVCLKYCHNRVSNTFQVCVQGHQDFRLDGELDVRWHSTSLWTGLFSFLQILFDMSRRQRAGKQRLEALLYCILL